MQDAHQRLDSADVILKGPEGRMKYRPLHAQLVARRCRMAAMLGTVYAVGPHTGTPRCSFAACAVWFLICLSTGSCCVPKATGSAPHVKKAPFVSTIVFCTFRKSIKYYNFFFS